MSKKEKICIKCRVNSTVKEFGEKFLPGIYDHPIPEVLLREIEASKESGADLVIGLEYGEAVPALKEPIVNDKKKDKLDNDKEKIDDSKAAKKPAKKLAKKEKKASKKLVK